MKFKQSLRAWAVPLGLMLVALIPVVAGSVRTVRLATGVRTPGDERFFASPAPVVAHVIGASFFCMLGALQMAPALRRRSPSWHRQAGRVVSLGGVVAAVSGTWMTLFYPHVVGDTWLLFVMRIVLGPALVLCLLRGVAAARGGRIAEHRAWMLRGYAIGMGAGTQAILHLPYLLTKTMPGAEMRTLLMGAGWGINLLIAEWLLRRHFSAATPAGAALAGIQS